MARRICLPAVLQAADDWEALDLDEIKPVAPPAAPSPEPEAKPAAVAAAPGGKANGAAAAAAAAAQESVSEEEETSEGKRHIWVKMITNLFYLLCHYTFDDMYQFDIATSLTPTPDFVIPCVHAVG